MTREQFDTLLSRTSVHPSRGRLLVSGIDEDELAELISIAGHSLGALPADACVNPEWLAMGPARNVHFMVHPEVLRSASAPSPTTT